MKNEKPYPCPYPAVILGEERIIEGWNAGRLVTDKGEFIIERFHANAPEEVFANPIGVIAPTARLETRRLLRVSSIHRNSKGKWIVDDCELDTLFWFPSGRILAGLGQNEFLQAHHKKIRAVAWFQTLTNPALTVEMKILVNDLREAQKRKPNVPIQERLRRITAGGRQGFLGWSKPVWLSEFRVNNQNSDSPPNVEALDDPELAASALALVMERIRDEIDAHHRRKPTASEVFVWICRDQMTVPRILAKNPHLRERTIKMRKQELEVFLSKNGLGGLAHFARDGALFRAAADAVRRRKLAAKREVSE